MKRIAALTLAFVLALGCFAGCAAQEKPSGGFDGSLEELAAKIYENHNTLELRLMTMEMDLSDPDAMSYNAGLSDVSNVEGALISEPMMGSQAYSLVLVRVKEGADAGAIAKTMLDNIDTRKWICVEADTKTAAYCGDIAMFFMVGSNFSDQVTTQTMLDAFKASVSGDVTVVG